MNNTPLVAVNTRVERATPVHTYRARHGSLYVPLRGEEAAAIRTSESFLIDFCGADFAAMPWHLRPAAIRAAQGHLLVVYLGNPSVADAFIGAVADNAELTKSELHQRLRDRAAFANHLPAILETNCAGALKEIESWLN